MEKEADFFADSKQKVKEYIQNRMLLLRLEMVEKTSKLVSVMFIGLLIAILSLFILLFLSFMAGYYFAALTNSLYLGFGIVCGFYILLLVFIILGGKKLLQKFITNTVIETIFDQTADNDDDDDTDNKEA
ncbi:phage holin family protein [Panacibacter sp. DH6]|uniref:Phage holin family protein n=1 Tax=Panacibacter microcysteis TaxID=2793269 RepID=A0A931E771_9BACT|nr:phage holin family protein [Panacibacter microcysteis]MBG9376343.1 phage holin family protein [Panacibacter microcysteis]